ncbi:MAG: alkaline phosphatase family protein [Reichenbachiella sp.]
MKRFFGILILILFSQRLIAQVNESRPKLVVGIVVDQMRQEYLSRFSKHFSEGGFKRFMNEGYSYKNAHYNYVPTQTGPGHASIYTGTTPRVHGIVSNDWYNKKTKRSINCVEDEFASHLGGSKKYGNRSPKNLMNTTVTDELRMFFQERTRIISISLKDRGAILPGGHNPNGAYWYDDSTGEFMTSTYYKKELPGWVEDFNNRKLPTEYMKKQWDTFFPIETYVESEKDLRTYENPLLPNGEPIFPYDLKAISKKVPGGLLLPNTPYGNTILVELAKEAIENESLGEDEITDFLAVSFSSTDYIGHAYGPYSKEIQDTYVRLDRDLEHLFNELDKRIGKGNWTMFLTADHAVAAIPHGLIEKKQKGNYWEDEKMAKKIKNDIEGQFKVSGLVEMVNSNQVYFNRDVLVDQKLSLNEVKSFTVGYLETIDGISFAYDVRKIHGYQGDQKDAKLISNGTYIKRSGDIIYALSSGWLSDGYIMGGTTHGSQYSYDTHVPLIFFGKDIKKGVSVDNVTITSIAPTISMLLNIGLPDGVTGQPLSEVLITE